MRAALSLAAIFLCACGAPGRTGTYTNDEPNDDLATPGNPAESMDMAFVRTSAYDGGGGQQGCGELEGCYTVYAHSDTVLYHVDLMNKLLVTVGSFNAPMVKDPDTGKMEQDTMTDLAVASDNTIYVISHSNLYTASPINGQVTLVTPVTACGAYAVALTFAPDGTLFAGDYKGAFCKIDPSVKPAKVTQITATLGAGLAIAGDIVSVADGTMYGTAQLVADGSTGATAVNNYLVKINPQTGIATIVGDTGFPKMFGVAYSAGQVFGFTHDGSGDVATIDPKTGKGTLYETFKDPKTKMGISFAGAGVNSMVAPTIM